VQLCERQALEYYKPPNFYKCNWVYMLYVLMHYVIGVGWKHLLHIYPSLSKCKSLKSYLSIGSDRSLALL
jgi:hypothetical protein